MNYTDISPRTNGYADGKLLERGKNNNILGRFGQSRPCPKNKTQVIKFRRYEKLANTPVVLQEGVTPSGKTLTKTDIDATLKQYGDFVRITDVIQDTHEDPVLNESLDILGLQAAEMMDKVYFGILVAGTNKLYANGTQRDHVNSVITDDMCRTAKRILKKQFAMPMTEMVEGGAKIATTPISEAFIAACHSDLQPDLERLSTWIPVEKYANTKGLLPGEMGSAGGLRFVMDNMIEPFADGGGLAVTNGVLSTTGTQADVYPILVFAKNAYGVVTLGGKSAVNTIIVNPKGDSTDPLAQRGSVGWKHYGTACILNDAWMVRLEVAAKG